MQAEDEEDNTEGPNIQKAQEKLHKFKAPSILQILLSRVKPLKIPNRMLIKV